MPGSQTSHVPEADSAVPGPQAAQPVCSAFAVCPGWHSAHCMRSVSAYWLAALQAVHSAAPSAETLPAGHAVLAVALHEWPAGHGRHALCRVLGWYVPFAHGVHSLPSALECVPAGHTLQAPGFYSAMPGSHLLQSVCSALGTRPGAHEVQKVWSLPVYMSAPLQALHSASPASSA